MRRRTLSNLNDEFSARPGFVWRMCEDPEGNLFDVMQAPDEPPASYSKPSRSPSRSSAGVASGARSSGARSRASASKDSS
jgi:hypothetical protein